jgi:hypothetical protein
MILNLIKTFSRIRQEAADRHSTASTQAPLVVIICFGLAGAIVAAVAYFFARLQGHQAAAAADLARGKPVATKRGAGGQTSAPLSPSDPVPTSGRDVSRGCLRFMAAAGQLEPAQVERY